MGESRPEGGSVDVAWVDPISGRVLVQTLNSAVGRSLNEAMPMVRNLLPEPARQELDEGRWVAAVSGQMARGDPTLHSGDRIELLAAVTVDPKLSRQRRVAVKRLRAQDQKWGSARRGQR